MGPSPGGGTDSVRGAQLARVVGKVVGVDVFPRRFEFDQARRKRQGRIHVQDPLHRVEPVLLDEVDERVVHVESVEERMVIPIDEDISLAGLPDGAKPRAPSRGARPDPSRRGDAGGVCVGVGGGVTRIADQMRLGAGERVVEGRVVHERRIAIGVRRRHNEKTLVSPSIKWALRIRVRRWSEHLQGGRRTSVGWQP